MEIENEKTDERVRDMESKPAADSLQEYRTDPDLTAFGIALRTEKCILPGLDLDSILRCPGELRNPLPERPKAEPFSNLELEGVSSAVADRLIKDELFDWRSLDEVKKLFERAANSGQLDALLDKINDTLKEKGSDLHLNYSQGHRQDKFFPEASPFHSWQEYTIRLNRGLKELSSMNFDANQTYHPGFF